jgi:hypothetical protein
LETLKIHWTASRKTLVVTGPPPIIQSVADELALPKDASVEIAPHRASLLVHGDALERFAQMQLDD